MTNIGGFSSDAWYVSSVGTAYRVKYIPSSHLWLAVESNSVQ